VSSFFTVGPHRTIVPPGASPSRPQSVDLIHPQLAKPFHRDGWGYEEKYDGWRIMAFT
jgi:ATP-dependent DNA ligase